MRIRWRTVLLFVVIFGLSACMAEAQGFWSRLRGRNAEQQAVKTVEKSETTQVAGKTVQKEVPPPVRREPVVTRVIDEDAIDEEIDQETRTIPPLTDPEGLGEDMMTPEMSRADLAVWLRNVLVKRPDLRSRMQGIEVEGEEENAVVRYNGAIVDENMDKRVLSVLWREVQDVINAINAEIMQRQHIQMMQQHRQIMQQQQQAQQAQQHMRQTQQAQQQARQAQQAQQAQQQAQQAQAAARQAQTNVPRTFQPPRASSGPPPGPPPGPPRR